MTRLMNLEKIELLAGSHDRREDGMCAMEAVAWLAGEKHSDAPGCACPAIGAFLRSYNDSADPAERQTLKAYLPRVVGSNLGPEVAERRAMLCVDWLIREYTPSWLDLADLSSEAAGLRSLAPVLSSDAVAQAAGAIATAKTSAAAARAAAGDAAGDAARAAAGSAAGYAAGSAAGAAAWAAVWDAAWYAAGSAAGAAAWDVARDAAWAVAREKLWPSAALRKSTLGLLDRMLQVAE